MRASRGAWRFVRPVLLGAAAAASWLTLSATGASADPLPEPDSLPASVSVSAAGLVDSAVNAVDQVTDGLLPSSQTPAQAPAPEISLPDVPRLQPAVHGVATAVDELVQTVPVVRTVVPAQTLPAATDPILTVVDDIAGFAVETIRPTADGLLETLHPVLPPANDVGAGQGCPEGQGDPAAPPAAGCSGSPVIPALPDIDAVTEGTADSPRFAPDRQPAPEQLPTATEQLADEDALAPAVSEVMTSHGDTAVGTAESCAEVSPEAALSVSSGPDSGGPAGAPQGGLMPVGSGSSVVSPSAAGPLLPGCLSGQHLNIPALAALPAYTELMKAPSRVSLDHESFPD